MKKTEINTKFQVQAALDLLQLFDIFVDTYKTVNDHPIGVHILIPKTKSTSGRRPILVKLHGGGWHEGTSDDWWRPWTLELALKHNAVVVSPDYRLMPESQFQDIADDLRDFWRWVDTDFEALPGLDVDTSNLAIVGESAGGHLSALSVLLGFSKQAAVVMLQYPALAIRKHCDYVTRAPAPQVPVSVLDTYLANVDPSKLLTRAEFATRMDLAYASGQSGRLVDLDRYPHLDPIKSLETADRIPPVFLFHGTNDTSVSVKDSQLWVEKLERLHPDVPIHAVYPHGEHVLDQEATLAEPWLKEPIAFVERYWPTK
ncbi:Alpha/Beta hydrolase protein [Truncatella angustata]|uniref:Alpha/Beta hydrolase protein n=1 Tax=Truncatella angustata TaxID=152316 RepID=A0A9P8UMW8_9PEZI|nr:Alpha/Beta hydrolase protein [Truncatella angustata]KAH6654840.1 Alpha/Beta hydrolase protein [Truncatella angustata]KAH8197032.1 hypothetical protein TruAng_008783 [Truncatella angustata]